MPYLFSYGSNNKDQLETRLKIKIGGLQPAYYPNHQLAFGSWSKNWGGAVGTLVKAKGKLVLGYVVHLENEDLDRLDKFEAVQYGKYERRRIRVKLKKNNQIKIAICYLLTEKHHQQWIGPPNDTYTSAIKKTISYYWPSQKISFPIIRSDTGKEV